ncbi:MAG: DNA repair protein RecO [Deltaproteobacteria bacterium]|nr:DNA repair protein RecO [Candidatus Tharpella sp.]
MPRVKDNAFIINKTEYGESDLIITLFTATRGKINTIGKGAKRSRRRFPGSLELFSLVAFNGFIKHPLALTRMDECQLIEPFTTIQEDLHSYFCGCYFLEIVNRCCAERQANMALFNLLKELFTFLATTPHNRNFNCQIRLFELQIITLLGFKPQLSACLDCGRELGEGRYFNFSPQTGGLVCPHCQPRHPASFKVSRGTINMLNQAHRLDNELRNKLNFTPQVERESARLCRALLSWHSGYKFKSLEIMERYTKNDLPIAKPEATMTKVKNLNDYYNTESKQ